MDNITEARLEALKLAAITFPGSTPLELREGAAVFYRFLMFAPEPDALKSAPEVGSPTIAPQMMHPAME